MRYQAIHITRIDPNSWTILYASGSFCRFTDVVASTLKKPFYTVIRAKMPQSWGNDVQREYVEQDVKHFSYRTSIGTSQFRVQVQNRVSFLTNENIRRSRGRPCKVGDFTLLSLGNRANKVLISP